MDVAALDYDLPEAAIAQQPVEPRDAARLLVDRGPGHEPLHRRVADLPALLRPGDVVVVNDARVRPARLHLRKPTGGAVEVLLLDELGGGRCEALVRPSRRVPPGTVLTGVGVTVTVEADLGDGRRAVQVAGDPDAAGEVPLPPYITGPLADPERYQTVYARRPASVAAPTAGLHLTPDLLDRCTAAGAQLASVELVVGLDTFRPVTAPRLEDHPMHSEAYDVPPATIAACRRARAGGGRVVAVGTTVVRALESAVIGPAQGRTDLFIRGDYAFKAVDVLLTNFHLPRTTLLALVDSFVGPRWRDLYATALANGYRFLSFGDAMLLERQAQRVTLQFSVEASDGGARTGVARTARGQFATPCFMPVGTRGAVRTLSSADLERLGVEVLLANTYHLMLRPGADVVAALGGLHRFCSWNGHLLTDSGGYQVFSLNQVAVDDDGVTFRSEYDGSAVRLTPEDAVHIQEQLGADIQMVLDVCPPLPSPPDVLRLAVERTAAWAQRARRTHRREGQALFGIVQGGVDVELRAESAARTVAVGFDGYGIGGLSVGEERAEMVNALAATTSVLPAGQVRYLMGVGDPAGLVDAVAHGVDLFDCVLPTRLGRHGTILTDTGRLNLRNAVHATDDGPLDPACACEVCARWSRAYLRHLLRVHEPTAPRLLTLHNLHWLLRLMERMRDSVRTGTFAAFRRDVRGMWGTRG